MAHGGDVEKRLKGHHQIGEDGLFYRPVAMHDFATRAGDRVGMEGHEAAPAGGEVGLRRHLHGKGQAAPVGDDIGR